MNIILSKRESNILSNSNNARQGKVPVPATSHVALTRNAQVVNAEEWRAARVELLKKEKEHTKAADELAKLRSDMPMTKVTEDYKFTGPNGTYTLADLFQGHKQLVLYHFMFDPSWDGPCKSCSFVTDNMPSHLDHLNSRDAAFVRVSRAPYEKLAETQKKMGWETFWVSSNDSSFNYDFHVTIDDKVNLGEWNYRSHQENKNKGLNHALSGEQPGFSIFIKEGEHVYHSYSTYGRGFDHLLTTYGLLDLTPLGRQDSKGRGGLGFEYHGTY